METTTSKDTGFITLKEQSKKYIIKKVGILTAVLLVLGFIAGTLTSINTNDFTARVVIVLFALIILFYWAFELNHIQKAVNELL